MSQTEDSARQRSASSSEQTAGEPLRAGSYAALVTPLRDDGSLDEPALRRLVRHVLMGGSAGVLVLGSSGEVAALSAHVRHRALEAVVDEVGSAGDVIAGIAQCAVGDAQAELAVVAAVGAKAALVTPPFYAPLDNVAVERFYRLLADRAEVPLFAYHIPAFTKQRIEPETFAALAADGAIAGVKDSNRDLEYLQQVLAVAPRGAQVFTGTDSMISAAVTLGVTGSITVAPNVAPAWAAELFAAAAAGSPAVAPLQARLSTLLFALRVGSFPAGIKAALSLLGLCGPTTAAPVELLSAAAIDGLARRLSALGVLDEPHPPAALVINEPRGV